MATIDTVMQGFSLGTTQGNLAFCGVTLIEGSKRILVDVAQPGRRRLLMDELLERNLTPDDIDYVLLTHAHWDHMLNIDLFPNAKVLISPQERQYIKSPAAHDWATLQYTSTVLESHKLQEVAEGEEIDDGVSVISTPGHSPGSMSLLVRGDEGTAAVCGDALPNTWSLTSGLPRIVFHNVEAARASIRKLLDSARFFYPGHDRPFRVAESGKAVYIEPTSISFNGWPDSDGADGGPSIGFSYEPERTANIEAPGQQV